MQSLDLGDCRLRNPRSREIERERERFVGMLG